MTRSYSSVAIALGGIGACGVVALFFAAKASPSSTAPAAGRETQKRKAVPFAQQNAKRLTALGVSWAEAAAVEMSRRAASNAPPADAAATAADLWSDESDEETQSLVHLPSSSSPPVVSDGPFTVGVAVQCDRTRLREFAHHGRRNGWFGVPCSVNLCCLSLSLSLSLSRARARSLALCVHGRASLSCLCFT